MNPRLAIAGIVSVLVQFALSILAWGGLRPFFSHPAFLALAIVTVALVIASLFTEANVSTGVREDRGNRWVLQAFGALAILGAILPAYTDRIGFWTLDGDAIRWLGIGIFTVGGALRIYPVFVLGRRFSGLVAIQPGHTLVTTGIYARIRNPSYLGMVTNVVGWALTFRSVVGLILAALMFVPLIARINAEEKMLRSQFGAEYDAYCARTSRLIPCLY